MRSRILIFSSLFCILGITPVFSAECIGEDCGFEGKSRILEVAQPAPVKIVSNTKKSDQVWDGSSQDYNYVGYDKTVDWRDGVPIWDDSIYSYKDKNFGDWTLPPQPQPFIIGMNYPQEPAQPALTDVQKEPDTTLHNQVEELLVPSRPSDNLWSDKKIRCPEFIKSCP